MQVGITGHQQRQGIDWHWVEATLCVELSKLQGVKEALSSLATGADQAFARAAISLGIPVVAVIPVRNYERFFTEIDRIEYEHLLQKSRVKDLGWTGEDQVGFFSAGRFIVDHTDLLFAVWDQQSSRGIGGTGDVVRYARNISRKIIHLNPITRRVRQLAG
jgi:hypothetical protein